MKICTDNGKNIEEKIQNTLYKIRKSIIIIRKTICYKNLDRIFMHLQQNI